MKILYFDCFSGISGNMVLGACVELGVDKVFLIKELKKLPITNWILDVKCVKKNGISGTYVGVQTKEKEPIYRTFQEIEKMIKQSELSEKVKQMALNMFLRIAKALTKIYQTTIDHVLLHEVCTIASIVDIVGTAICMDYLKPDKIYCSIIKDGHGYTKCQHSIIPIPIPVSMEILSEKNISIQQVEIESELVTPTGAGIIAELCSECCLMPRMEVQKVGYGAGKKEFHIPNFLRVIQGVEKETVNNDTVLVMQTNVDDCSPEILSYAMEQLFEAGAYDVFYTMIGMKKSRQAICLTILCEESKKEAMETVLFSETTTIGVRYHLEQRTILPRKIEEIDTKYGKLKVKCVNLDDAYKSRFYPEYESAKLLAKKNGVPLLEIYQEVNRNHNVITENK